MADPPPGQVSVYRGTSARATDGKGVAASGVPVPDGTPTLRPNGDFSYLVQRVTQQVAAEVALHSRFAPRSGALDLRPPVEVSHAEYSQRHGVPFVIDVERFVDVVEEAAFHWLERATTANLQTIASVQSTLLAERTIAQLHAGAERFVAETQDQILPEYEIPAGPAYRERLPREIPGRRAHNATVELAALVAIGDPHLKLLYLHPEGRGAILKLAESAPEGATTIESLLIKAYDANREFFGEVAQQHRDRRQNHERSHLWRYPPIIMGALKDLGLQDNDVLVAFTLQGIAPLRSGEAWKQFFLVAGIALAAVALVATGPLGVLVAAVDFGLAGLEAYRGYIAEMQNLLAARAGAVPGVWQLTERQSDFGSVALQGAAVLISGFALLRGGLTAFTKRVPTPGRPVHVVPEPSVPPKASRSTGPTETAVKGRAAPLSRREQVARAEQAPRGPRQPRSQRYRRRSGPPDEPIRQREVVGLGSAGGGDVQDVVPERGLGARGSGKKGVGTEELQIRGAKPKDIQGPKRTGMHSSKVEGQGISSSQRALDDPGTAARTQARAPEEIFERPETPPLTRKEAQESLREVLRGVPRLTSETIDVLHDAWTASIRKSYLRKHRIPETQSPVWLDDWAGKQAAELLHRLARTSDPVLIAGANRFARADGFPRVLKAALSGNRSLRQGGRFVIRYAVARVPIGVSHFQVVFESRETIGDIIRYVDLTVTAGGIRSKIELKSIQHITRSLVAGEEDRWGQLVKDLVRQVGDRKRPFERFRSARWVFDSERLVEPLDEDAIARRLYGWLTEEGTLIHEWPEHLKAELLEALREVIVLFPDNRVGLVVP
jgi:hypothetical protein